MKSHKFYSRIKSTTACLLLAVCLLSQAIAPTPAQAERPEAEMAAPPVIDGCSIFPSNNVWNTQVDTLPVHARSSQWINSIGATTGFHMDFGTVWDGGPIGIPYNIVGSGVPKVSVNFDYDDESDAGPYPIPANPSIEYGSDAHILIVDKSTCTLYELYAASYSGGQWYAGSGAIWNLNSNDLRPDGWTSADAAGLPILPGLVRYDEVVSGEINHAIRFTAEDTNGYIWPARHLTSDDPDALHIPPMGARFRLKSNYDISGYPAAMQVILRAMKKYGIILADNAGSGSNWYVSGAPNSNWDDEMLHLLDDVTGSDFEAVDTSSLMIDYDSGETTPIPEAALLNSPTGGITTNTPAYSWSQVTGATYYYLWVNGPSGNVIKKWYTSAEAGCGDGTCSVTPTTALSAGVHKWWVQTYSNVLGPWSAEMTFTVIPPALPGKAILSAPAGNVATNTPRYTWGQVSGATWYYLYVNGPSGNVIKQWYEASAVCGSGTCSITPAVTLSAGAYKWWVQTYNSGGYGSWSDRMDFTVAVPGKAILSSPTGTLATNQPTYTWTAVPTATWYYLWVNGPSGNVIKQWYASSAICGSGTCSINPGTALGSGAHTWWVQTWNPVGYGAWSDGKGFTTP